MQGELIPPSDRSISVVAVRNPFRLDRVELTVSAGSTIAEILTAVEVSPRQPAHVFIDDWYIPRDRWYAVRPRPGRTVTIRVVPAGGGGRGGGKNPLRTILTIAVIAVAAAVSGGALAPVLGQTFAAGTVFASVAGAAVGMVGALLVNALVPPPKPQLGQLSSAGDLSQTYAITGAANRPNPYGVVPRVMGRHRFYPPPGAQPFSELVGNDQYYRLLFNCGYGPLALSDMRIGTTPLSAFDGVEVEVRQGYPGDPPLTLFSNDVHEETFQVALTKASGWTMRTSLADVDELSVDVACPQLVRFNDGGTRSNATVQIEIQYAPAGSGAWVGVTTLTLTDRRTSAVRRGHRWTVVRGRYDVRLRRVTADSMVSTLYDQSYWTVLRSIRAFDPIQLPGLAKVALRIKATDQLHGILDQFNLIAASILPDWNGAAWVSRATSNPASIYRAILQSSANARPTADARLDLIGLQSWHDECRINGRLFNAVFDTAGTVFERLRAVAAVGRAAFGMRDGKYSVVRDLRQSVPVQHFTPRNSWGFRAIRQYASLPHGLKVRFINPAREWQQDEVIVYADGYTAANATLFEVVELFGVTDADQAWKEGRYHLAVGRLRPEVYELNADVEHIVCARGSLVRVGHDVLMIGLATGRIKGLTTDAEGKVTGVTLDEAVPMAAGTSYGLVIRREDNSEVSGRVVTQDGETMSLTFAAPLAAAAAPKVGDLTVFGELGRETVDLVVKAIDPGPDLTARLTLVDAAPAVHDADAGTIPPFESRITLPPGLIKPFVTGVRSDSGVMMKGPDGSLQSRIMVTIGLFSGTPAGATGIERSYRPSGSGAWQPLPTLPGLTTEVPFEPVVEGETYDLRLRYARAGGFGSVWAEVVSHKVVGGSDHPGDVQGFAIAVLGDQATLSWRPATEIDFSHWTIKFSPVTVGASWGSATDLLPHVTTTSVQVATLVGTFLIKAVDVGGRASLNAALVASDIARVEGFNVVEEHAEHPAWAGAKADISVVNGRLQLDSTEVLADWPTLGEVFTLAYGIDGVVTEGLYAGAGTLDLGAIYTSRIIVRLTAHGANLANVMATWLGLGQVETLGGTDPAQWGVAIEIRTTRDDPNGAPTWSDWKPFLVGDYTARAVEHRLRLTSSAPTVTPIVTKLEIEVDMPDRVEAGEDLVCPAEGLRVDFAPAMRALKGLGVAEQNLLSGDRKVIANKGPTGFDIRFYDAAGNAVERTFDFVAKGYGREVEGAV